MLSLVLASKKTYRLQSLQVEESNKLVLFLHEDYKLKKEIEKIARIYYFHICS